MASHEVKDTWFEQLTRPIRDSVVGMDLIQDARFFRVRSEINKRENINLNTIKTLCIELLCQESKDLRLFSYLLFACLLENDMDTWLSVLDSLLYCLEQYENRLYPLKPQMKAAALMWLNQDRVRLIFMERLKGLDTEKLGQYLKVMENINHWLDNHLKFTGENVRLGFEQWLKAKNEVKIGYKLGPAVEPRDDKAGAKDEKLGGILVEKEKGMHETKLSPLEEKPKLQEDKIHSNLEAEVLTLKLIEFHVSNGRQIQAAAFRRALRWGALNPHLEDKNKTALNSFSAENEAFLAGTTHHFDEYERLFLQPGGQIKLDIQYGAIQAAKGSSPALAQYLEDALRAFLHQHPGAENWRYNDNTVCTSEKVKEWIRNVLLDKKREIKSETSIETESKELLNPVLNQKGYELSEIRHVWKKISTMEE